MKIFSILASAAVLLAAASFSHAQAYVGLGISGMDIDRQTFVNPQRRVEFNPVVAQLQLGYRLGKYASLEARAGYDTKSDRANLDNTRIKLTVKRLVGIYAKAILPTQLADVYALVGYNRFDIKEEALGTFSKGDSSDLAYGLGTDIHLGPRIDLLIELARLYDQSGERIHGLLGGVNYKF